METTQTQVESFKNFEEEFAVALHANQLTVPLLEAFKTTLWCFYKQNKRDFPWRNTTDPYCIVVSEIMLQQTQTSRVQEKYLEFIKTFPDFVSLAKAPFSAVLVCWVGLGYNRRAMALHGIAQKVVTEFGGQLPCDVETLKTFKGLGHATASSIVAFAFNKPTEFIETNIRAVYLHTFYRNQIEVDDKMLLPLIALTVDKENPREWYYALMDYGVVLKKLHKNPSRKSKHHTQQSAFEGSDRQIRGAILRLLTQKSLLSLEVICEQLSFDGIRIETQVQNLCKEGFLQRNKEELFFL